MDTLDTVELVQQVNDVEVLSTVVLQKKILPVRLLRAPREKWCSTLDAQSLRCLLSVLETSVIPQLINAYSPAAIAPLPIRHSTD